jgi:site-specific DNA recombinase
MYADKLDGRIDARFYSQMAETWQEIEPHEDADRSYIDEGVRMIDLAHGAQRLLAKQNAHEQRRLLNFGLSNSTWKHGELKVTYRQPFDLVAEATAIATRANNEGALYSPEHPVWLGN